MIEIKFLGKGGQGVVVASEILARSCFEEGMYPQCFSIFGGERRGANVAAFIRIDREKIFLKCDIKRPDHLVLFDGSLFNEEEIIAQAKPGGLLLLNMEGNYQSEALGKYKIGKMNALEISKKNGLGAIVNTAILGAYVRLSQIIGLDTLLRVIKDTVPAAIRENLNAAQEAYESVSII
jgi:2-oxoacid:acceptor oxidoreductase gamma subunit (pyruvate/2-ketoisovalerate family)